MVDALNAGVVFEKLRRVLSLRSRKLGMNNLRLKFIKIAAVVTYNTRRSRLLINDKGPHQQDFIGIVQVFSAR